MRKHYTLGWREAIGTVKCAAGPFSGGGCMKRTALSLVVSAALLIAVHPIAADQTELEEFAEQSRSIQQRNAALEAADKAPYPYLDPAHVASSVAI